MTQPTDVVLYVQPHCSPCHALGRFLSEQGVSFTTRDVSRDAAALRDLAERGFMATPVARVGDHWIAGFNRRDIMRAIEDGGR